MKPDNQLCLNCFKTAGSLKSKENRETFDLAAK